MHSERASDMDLRIQQAIDELQDMIRARYPTASFDVGAGDDPVGIYLTVTVDLNDTEEVTDLYIERLIDMQVEEGLPVYVMPIRPLKRVLQSLGLEASTSGEYKP